MPASSLDDFADVSGWSAITSGQAGLQLSRADGPRGSALRLAYDFKDGGGFVVARKLVRFSLPEAYAYTFMLRGEGPPNNFELKLVDPSNKNVWRYCRAGFDLPHAWQPLVVRSRDLEFAWGPAGGGPMAEVGAIEIAVTAGPGGAGSLAIADLEFHDRSLHSLGSVTASSSTPGHEPAGAFDHNAATRWRSAPSAAAQWYQIDFLSEHEYGGLIVTWDRAAMPRRVEVQNSRDGAAWQTERTIDSQPEVRSYIYVPGGAARYLRLLMEPESSAGVGIVGLEVKPFEFSRSLNEFFHGIAARERRGLYPKYFCRQQTYWTPVGIGDGSATALINEEGMVEVDADHFSVEPFLHVDDKLITWADADIEVSLEEACLPVPSSCWRHDDLNLAITAFAGGAAHRGSLFVRYRVSNDGGTARRVRFLAAVRPFQVTPPWQSVKTLGGVSPIHDIEWDGRALHVNGRRSVFALRAPTHVGAAPFEGGTNEDWETGCLPAAHVVHDNFGFASAALCYDLELAAGGSEEICIEIPFAEAGPPLPFLKSSLPQDPKASETPISPEPTSQPPSIEKICDDWRRRLAAIDFEIPAATAAIDTLKTAIAHILIVRDGPALQPGARRYARSWIRDGAIMAAALLRAGCNNEARDFARWYRQFQRADGFVPCCVDRHGVDPLVEHDSHGQLVYAMTEYYRFSGDIDFVREMWPAALKAIEYIDRLRQQRLTAEHQARDKMGSYGLLPESASHEGYLAQPVHSYWDDFWALRGLKDAAAMAEALGEKERANWIWTIHRSMSRALYASIRHTIAVRHLDYIPGSVEWADFDPTATANAIAMLDESTNLPEHQLTQMFATYLADFRHKHAGTMEWSNYSPYEIRIIGALVRRGQREGANELLSFFLADRRPRAWNQWPEIAWRDPTSPGHIGDMPHAWIAAEYALSLLSMFVYEREADRALVIGAGIPDHWLDDEAGVTARGLRTWYGGLDLRMRRDSAGAIHIVLDGRLTTRKLVLRPPLKAPLRAVTLNGGELQYFGADEVEIDTLPAEVVMR